MNIQVASLYKCFRKTQKQTATLANSRRLARGKEETFFATFDLILFDSHTVKHQIDQYQRRRLNHYGPGDF